jgi:hypothetical protein
MTDGSTESKVMGSYGQRIKRVCRILWASPWSLIGLAIGICGLLSGGTVRTYRGTVICYGSMLDGWLRSVPIRGGASAMTFGHCILARSQHEALATHPHELVHVRQYERWGFLFVPAYFISSLYCWAVGADPYRDNAFEREAYEATSE